MCDQYNYILSQIRTDPIIKDLIDFSLKVPSNWRGIGEIKLIILGQDPTVKKPEVRGNISVVLNLDKSGPMKRYISKICFELGLSLDENIFATNFFKNFFVHPPAQIKKIDALSYCKKYWLPILKKEIDDYPNVPIIAFGEPLLQILICEDVNKRVREYWGYDDNWLNGIAKEFRYLKPQKNVLNRNIFPFPHQPSIGKKFYSERLVRYLEFLKPSVR